MSENFCIPFQKPPLGKGERRIDENGEMRCTNLKCPKVHKDVPENEMDKARIVANTLEEQKVWRAAERKRLASAPPGNEM